MNRLKIALIALPFLLVGCGRGTPAAKVATSNIPVSVTLAPTTVAPATVAPVTAPPTTAAPVTAPPTTAAPVTAPPTTRPPVTAPPVTTPAIRGGAAYVADVLADSSIYDTPVLRADILGVGVTTCHSLDVGIPFATVAEINITHSGSISGHDEGALLGYAVKDLCPSHMAEMSAWAASAG